MTVKTEFASVEENDGLIRKAIERRAYELYELDGFKDGSDQEHWFRAEKELTIQISPPGRTPLCLRVPHMHSYWVRPELSVA